MFRPGIVDDNYRDLIKFEIERAEACVAVWFLGARRGGVAEGLRSYLERVMSLECG